MDSHSFLGGVLAELFGVMNKMQIMVHLLLINVAIPANARIFFSGLLSFVTFGLIDFEPTFRKILHLSQEDDHMLS